MHEKGKMNPIEHTIGIYLVVSSMAINFRKNTLQKKIRVNQCGVAPLRTVGTVYSLFPSGKGVRSFNLITGVIELATMQAYSA